MVDDERGGPVHADLVGLLSGELGRDEALAAGRHLHACRNCAEELTDVALAHGALLAAARAERDLSRPPRPRQRSGTGVSTPGDGTSEGPSSTGPGPRPHPAAAQLRPLAPATGTIDSSRPAHRSRRWGVVVTGVAASVALGVLGITSLVARRTPDAPAAVAQSALQRLQAPSVASGSVTVSADGATRHMIVRTRDLRSPSSQDFFEVWLLNPRTQKMLPVGVLPPSGTGSYVVTAALMGGYSAVDVSLQANDGNPQHSRTSVLRASLSL